MDPPTCQANFEVKQPPCGLATRALFYGPIIKELQNLSPCSEDTKRLHDLKLCLASKWVHMDNIWDI